MTSTVKLAYDFLTVPDHAPSPEEVKLAQDMLEGIEEMIMQRENLHSGAKSTNLKSEDKPALSSLRHKAANIKAFLAPIRRLPEEILSHIFLYSSCEPSSSNPWILTRVCRFFRLVAFATPHIWTSVRFHIDESRQYFEGAITCRSLNELRATFSLSRELPLLFKIEIPARIPMHYLLNGTLGEFNVVAPRLQRLIIHTRNLYASQSHVSSRPFTLITAPLTSLYCLDLEGGRIQALINSLFPLVDNTALNLRVFRLEGIDEDINTSFEYGFWERLTELTLDESFVSSILPQCTNLRKLTLHLSHSGDWTGRPWTRQFELPHLEEMIYSGHELGMEETLFTYASLPSLRKLTLWHEWFDAISTWPIITLPSLVELDIDRFQTLYIDTFAAPRLTWLSIYGSAALDEFSPVWPPRSESETLGYFGSLEVLELGSIDIAPIDLYALLEANPYIKRIQLFELYITVITTVLVGLHSMADRPLCPKLEFLQIGIKLCPGRRDYIYRMMLEAIVGRRKLGLRLLQVILDGEDPPNLADGEFADRELQSHSEYTGLYDGIRFTCTCPEE